VVNDTDRGILIGDSKSGTGRFFVTNDNKTWMESWVLDRTLTATGAGSTLTDPFPNLGRCTYGIRQPQWWKAGFESSCYSNANSSVFFINVTTHALNVTLYFPKNNWTARLGVDPINITGNVSDDCGYVTGFTGSDEVDIIAVRGANSYECTNTQEYLPGRFNCTITPAQQTGWDMGLGRYNTTINATKQFYTNSLIYIDCTSLALVSNPKIVINTVDASDPNLVDKFGWGETWFFTVNVSDNDQGASDFLNFEKLNISLWYNLTGNWELVETKFCSGATCAQSYMFNYSSHDFNYTHIGTRQYKFNVTDIFGYVNESSADITIKADDVLIGVNTTPTDIGREGTNTTLISFSVYDDDNKTAGITGINGSIWITTDGSVYTNPVVLSTNASGYFNYNFDPNCSQSVGGQYWIGGVENDYRYKANNLTGGGQYFEVFGRLRNYLDLPLASSTYNVTQQVPVAFTTYSDCKDYPALRSDENPVVNADTYGIAVWHATDGWTTCSSSDFNNGTYNCSFNTTDHREGNWTVQVNSTESFFYGNSTNYTDRFWLENTNTSASNAAISVLDSGAWRQQLIGGWTREFNFTIDVTDTEGDNINCTLLLSMDNTATWEIKGSDFIAGAPGIPTTGTCSVRVHDFECGDIDTTESGSYDFDMAKWFMWEVRDNETDNYFNTTPVQGPNITESNITIIFTNGENTELTRGRDNLRFGVNVYDDENSTYPAGVNVSYWITNDSSTQNLELVNTTVAGNASYYFTPNCSHLVGAQNWIAGTTDSCYQNSNIASSHNYDVFGWFNISIQTPAGEEYLRGSNITIRTWVNDECDWNVSDATVEFNMTSDKTSAVHTCTPVLNETNGWYNCKGILPEQQRDMDFLPWQPELLD